MVKPRVFVSSTVRDLADLRSAVRYFLEQYGLEVLTSESPDFPHALDSEAWKAALAPIDLADYFVSVVGDRAGWITESGISVTRAEFRRARELHREKGRPKVVVLARANLLREGATETTEDGAAVQEFLDEIRTGETDRDTTWIHGFDTFEEVAVVLRTGLRLTGPLSRKIHEANIYAECLSNGRALLMRARDTVGPISRLARDLPAEARSLDANDLSLLTSFRLMIPGPGRLSTVATADAISSGEFLEFDPGTGSMHPSGVHSLLLTLRERVSRYEHLLEIISNGRYAREFAEMAPIGGSHRPSDEFLTIACAIRDELRNVESLIINLSRVLVGLDDQLAPPALNPPTPDPIQAARIAAESVSDDEVKDWFAQTRQT